MTTLDIHSVLSAADKKDLLYQFDSGVWSKKSFVGDRRTKSVRFSPCIKIEDFERPYRGLYAFQAMHLIVYGPVPVGMTISHGCCHKKKTKKKKRISPCVNFHHFNLEPVDMNSGRSGHQKDLVDYKVKWESTRNLKGPQFLDDIGDSKRCVHNKANPGDSCFINCCSFKRLTRGLYWYHPTRTLLRDMRLGGFKMVDIDD